MHGRDAPALVEQVPPAAKSQQGFLKASWSLEKDTAEVVLRPGPLRRPSPVPPLSRSGTVSNFGFQGREGLGRDKQEHSVPMETAGHLLGHLLNRCDLPRLAGQAPPPPGTGTCGAVPTARTGSAALTPGAPRAPRSLRTPTPPLTPGAGCRRKGRPPWAGTETREGTAFWNALECGPVRQSCLPRGRAGQSGRGPAASPGTPQSWKCLGPVRPQRTFPSGVCGREGDPWAQRRQAPRGARGACRPHRPCSRRAGALAGATRGRTRSLPPPGHSPARRGGYIPARSDPAPRHVSKYKSQEGRLRPQTCPRTGTQRRRTWRLPRPRGWARPAAEAPPRPLPHPWPAGATVPGQPRAPCRPLLHTVRELPDGGDRRGGADRALSPPESQGGAGGRLGGKAGGAGSWTQHRSAPRRRPAATRSHTPRQDRPTSPKTHRLLCVGSEAKSHLELPRCLHEKHSLRALCDGDGRYGGESQAPPPTALPKYLPGNLQQGRPSLPSLTSDTVKDFQRTRSN